MKEKIKSLVRKPYHCLRAICLRARWTLFGSKPVNLFEIPIIINNFNRLTYLKQLIDSLTERGYNNIYIIDNKSSYSPLLKYYKTCPYKVFRLDENVGYLSLWKTDIHKQFQKGYFVYTDADLLIQKECPNDFMEYFYEIMQRHKNVQKVGFGLKIDDLPDHYDKKNDVIEWESKICDTKEIEKGVIKVGVDTTFALYRPFVKWGANFYVEQYRTKSPYMMHHLPWYIDSENPSPEDVFYSNSVQTRTHWSKTDNNK